MNSLLFPSTRPPSTRPRRPQSGACERFSLVDILTATNHWAPQLLVGDGYRVLFKGVDPRDGVTPWLLKRCRTREFEEFYAEVRGAVRGKGRGRKSVVLESGERRDDGEGRRVKQTCGKQVAEMGNNNHPNLVRLLGYCDERHRQRRWEKVVVYEYMTAGSLLDKFQPGG
ncbi:unnamed protein product [Closterium sp. Naga37s-1]|nr:unnamed protein product [Closterium sp. Naga37s-1]